MPKQQNTLPLLSIQKPVLSRPKQTIKHNAPNLREHALTLLETLLLKEQGKRRIKTGEKFLTSFTKEPSWEERPEQWASDWCEGWAFHPNFVHASALGVELTKRQRKVYVTDADGNPVPDTDAEGNIKKEKGKIIYKSFMQQYFVWTQSTAFDFRAGYIVYSAALPKDETWGQHLEQLGDIGEILDAKPASPGNATIPRDPGQVQFRILHKEADNTLKPSIPHLTTQDGFVRFLITGELQAELIA